MGNSKENRLRMEGFAMAVRIAQEKGIETLVEESKLRGAYGMPCGLKRVEIEEFYHDITEKLIETLTVIDCTVLNDHFGFDEVKLNKFMVESNNLQQCIRGGFTTMDAVKMELQEKLDLQFVDDTGDIKTDCEKLVEEIKKKEGLGW